MRRGGLRTSAMIDAHRRVYRLYRNTGNRRGTARWRHGPRPLARCASLDASGAAGCVAVIGKVTVSVTVYFDNHDNLYRYLQYLWQSNTSIILEQKDRTAPVWSLASKAGLVFERIPEGRLSALRP